MFNWFNRSSKSGGVAGHGTRIEPAPVPVVPPADAAVAGTPSDRRPSMPGHPPARLQDVAALHASPSVQRRLSLLPPSVSLARSCASHPHAVERLLQQWANPIEFQRILGSMLVDLRGGRRGFSFDVMAELGALGDFYDRFVDSRERNAWASLDPR
jgi:hypothetical protein